MTRKRPRKSPEKERRFANKPILTINFQILPSMSKNLLVIAHKHMRLCV